MAAVSMGATLLKEFVPRASLIKDTSIKPKFIHADRLKDNLMIYALDNHPESLIL
jgi:hypothetical protein